MRQSRCLSRIGSAEHMDDLAVDEPTSRELTIEPSETVSEGRSWGSTLLASNQRWLVRLVYVLALLPAIYTIRKVHQSPLMPFQDYWTSLVRITNPDGSLHLRGLFSYQNEHPFFVPNVVYYLDARFFDGTNRVTGYYSVFAAILTVVLLRVILPRQWSPLARASATLAISTIVFCPSGLWNFVRGMSGAAWLSANVLAIAAIVLASRRRTIPAVIVAAFSILSYGTGFGAPIAISLVALLRRDRWWRCALPVGLLAAASIVYALTSNGGSTGTSSTRDPALFASTMLSNLGMLWDPSGGPTALLFGAFGLLLLAVTLAMTWRRNDLADLIPWWGVATYSIVAAALISLARSEVFGGDGVQGRYASLSALFWIAVIVVTLRVYLARRPLALQVGAVSAIALVFLAGSPPLMQQAVSTDPKQDLLATAARVNAAGPFAPIFPYRQLVIPRLEALGDYPFDSKYSLGCGGLVPGDTIDTTKLRTLQVSYQNGTAGHFDTDAITADARRMTGWIRRGAMTPKCVLIIDAAGKIVGGGTGNVIRADLPGVRTNVGFDAVAPSSALDARLVIGYDDGLWLDPVTPAAS